MIENEHFNVNALGNVFGYTAISIDAAHGQNHALKKLLSHSANINFPNKSSVQTPLKMVCNNGFIEAVRLLLKAGAEVNTEDRNGYTPLFVAFNKPEIAQLLIDNDADVNHQAHNGATPLDWAAAINHLQVMRLLVSSDARDDFKDDEGLTTRDMGK